MQGVWEKVNQIRVAVLWAIVLLEPLDVKNMEVLGRTKMVA